MNPRIVEHYHGCLCILNNDTNDINHVGSVSDIVRRKARRKREGFIKDHELVTLIT